jgi:Mg/Co/Ni transporter MgtE
MADAQALTLAFLGEHPAEAARVMESIPAAEAAALIAGIPARIAAPVMNAMLPAAVGRLLVTLGDEDALALISATGAQGAVAMLRQIAEPRRTRLINALPTLTALASRALLGFPEDAAGAWTDPEVITVAPGTRAKDALERCRQSAQASIDRVLVVDAEQRLLGEVRLEQLLQATDASSVASLMQPVKDAIAAMMPLRSAMNARGWEYQLALAVIDAQGRLVGILRRATLLQAVRDRSAPEHARQGDSVTSVLALGYWTVLSGLASSALTLLPGVKRVKADGS